MLAPEWRVDSESYNRSWAESRSPGSLSIQTTEQGSTAELSRSDCHPDTRSLRSLLRDDRPADNSVQLHVEPEQPFYFPRQVRRHPLVYRRALEDVGARRGEPVEPFGRRRERHRPSRGVAGADGFAGAQVAREELGIHAGQPG